MKLEMKCITDAAPVQYQGFIDDYYLFYFRVRGNGWSFRIPSSLTGPLFERTGTYVTEPFEASAMPLAEAERLIRACCVEYLAELAKLG
jgi:hypothetical protein